MRAASGGGRVRRFPPPARALRARDLPALGEVVRIVGQYDGGKFPAVIGLLAMRGTAKGEEVVLVLIGAGRNGLYLGDTGLFQAMGDIARQIELPMAGAAAGREEARIGGL